MVLDTSIQQHNCHNLFQLRNNYSRSQQLQLIRKFESNIYSCKIIFSNNILYLHGPFIKLLSNFPSNALVSEANPI